MGNNTASDDGCVLNVNLITNEFVLTGNRMRNNIANTSGSVICVKLSSAETILDKNDTMNLALNNNHFANNFAWNHAGAVRIMSLYACNCIIYFIFFIIKWVYHI